MKTLLVLLAASLLSGCTIIRYENTTAGTRTTVVMPLFGSRSIDGADLKEGKVGNVRSEQTQMGEAIGVGVAAGMKALKP